MKSQATVCVFLLFLFLFLQLLSPLQAKPYNCQFGSLYSQSSHYRNTAPQAQDVLMKGRRLLQTMDQMRITLNTDDLATIKTMANGKAQTTQRLAFIKKAMQVAASFYSTRLKVSPESLISIPSTCLDYSPPSTDISDGIANSDMHIYVLYSTGNNVSYGATGVSCSHVTTGGVAYPDTTKRAGKPVSGKIIFNTYNIIDQESRLTNRLFASITSTALHETLHILGFDQNLYDSYMDESGNLHTSMYEQVSLHSSRMSNYLLKTPKVLAWAKEHFGCSTLTGVPLENEDGGTKGSHWERLTVYDEIMTGTSLGPQKIFTALTFAMLMDMGWYEVDNIFNDTTNYGYHKGCDFVKKACYAETPDPKYFCNVTEFTGVSECSTTFTGKAVCNSTNTMSDGCGIFADHLFCVDNDAEINGYTPRTLEDFGISSFCTKGTLATIGITSNYRGRCYPHTCDYENNRIIFKVGVYTVYCLSSNQGSNKTHSDLQGYIECPVFSDFCTNSRKFCPNWCSQNGFCTRGICNCYSDDSVIYSGEDCSITSCVTTSDYYDPNAGTCASSCPTGTYANPQSRTCLPCSSQCQNCRDEPSICTSCLSTPANPSYYSTVTNQCVSLCPSGTFLHTDDKCYPCDSATTFCNTCVTSATMCLTCANGYFWTTVNINGRTDGTCATTCLIGSFLIKDVVNKQCVATCPNYLVHDTDNNWCNFCSTGFKVIDTPGSTCVVSCSDGYYTDEERKVCDNCDSSCKTCYQRYAENCTTCKSTGTLNYWFLDMCLQTCPGGYYQNLNTNKCELCDVTLFCSTCSFNNATITCLTCKYGYFLKTGGVCTQTCTSAQYKNMWNQSCDSCHSDCLTCTGPSETQCLTCQRKFFLANSTGGYCLPNCPSSGYVRMTSSCESCHQSCLTCSGLTSANCDSCRHGFFLEAQKCRYVCSPGKYPDGSTEKCETCHSACTYCFGGTVNNCTECVINKVLNNFTCTNSCPKGYSPNSYEVCQLKKFESLVRWAGLAMLGLLIAMI